MEILTLEEVGALLKLKPSSVYELTRERSQARQKHPIPFMKIAGKVRFRRHDVEEWIEKLAARGK